jgi:hypothetical protein
MEAIFADEFTITYPKGAVTTKADVLAQLGEWLEARRVLRR